MQVKWKFFDLDLMSDMPLMITRCVHGGQRLASLPRKTKVPSGSGLVFAGPRSILLNHLTGDNGKLRNHDAAGLGVFYYRLGRAHAGVRAIGWAIGAPVNISIGLAGAAYGDIRRSQFLPRRVEVADSIDGTVKRRWQAPSISTDYASAGCEGAAGEVYPLLEFGVISRACVVVFPAEFRFNAKEYGGKAVWNMGNALDLSTVATICQTQLGA